MKPRSHHALYIVVAAITWNLGPLLPAGRSWPLVAAGTLCGVIGIIDAMTGKGGAG